VVVGIIRGNSFKQNGLKSSGETPETKAETTAPETKETTTGEKQRKVYKVISRRSRTGVRKTQKETKIERG
jgi:hypothetical protein